jgi:hypothetical protein
MALEPRSPIDAKCDLKVDDDMQEVSQDGELLIACLEVGDLGQFNIRKSLKMMFDM